MNKNFIEFLGNFSFLKKLDQASLDKILMYSKVKMVTKDTTVFLQGDSASAFYIVLNGSLKLFTLSSNGAESIKSLLTEGDFFGQSSLLDNANYAASAITTRASQLLYIDGSFLRSEMKRNSNLAGIVIEELLANQNRMEHQIEYLSVMNATQRVGWYIINYLLRNKGGVSGINLKHDKSLIATFLGMKPETFSRSIKKLRDANVRVEGAKIYVSDLDLLQRFCTEKDNVDDTRLYC